jgi:hypothetical protein
MLRAVERTPWSVAAARPLLLVLLVLIVPAAVIRASDTGSIAGAVFGPTGEPVAEATVRISGERLPVPRTVTTGANGSYQFDYLLPGAYVIEVEKTGLGLVRRSTIAELGKDNQVDVVLGIAITEEVVVTAGRPGVDVRSTEVSFNFKADAVNALPLERTYRGLYQLIPGVADNRSTVGPAAGGNRQDNTYLMDGANITNPGFGYLGSEVNELDIAEINLKRAGISAEFGRTSGTVTNVVSRSGSNRFAGVGRFDWLPAGLVNAYKLPDQLVAAGVKPGTFRDPVLVTQLAPTAGLGGPVLTDRLFFYGSARYGRDTKFERVNKVGTILPDEVRTGQEYFGKLTAPVTPNDQLSVSYRHRPSHVENAGIDSNSSPSIATTTDNGSRIASAEWARFFAGRSSFAVRYLYMKENNEDVPVLGLGYLPAFTPGNLAAMGQFNDPSQADLKVGGNQYTNVQNYQRHEVRGTFTRFFDLRASSHVLKAGAGFEFGQETFNRLANGWGSISTLTVNGVPALRTRYYTAQASQLGQGRTHSLFVQDDMSIGRTTVNVGVLLNRDEFTQRVQGGSGCPADIALKGGAAVFESNGDRCTFLRFGFGDEIQPRLGVSYQVREGAGDKAYANWGRYYNMDQKSAGRSLAPNRIFQTETVFDTSGNVLSSGPLASTTGKLIDPAIEPIYTDEVLVGYSSPIGNRYSLDIFFMSRGMHQFIEDVPSRLGGPAPNSGPFVAANLPCVAFATCQAADARRTYRALTAVARRQMADRWMADVSYTWSRFEGNFDLDYASIAVFNTSSAIQDGPGTNVEDPNRFGPLFEDRPHVFKVFTSYAVTSRVNLAGYFRVQSGTPWAARARDWSGNVLNYLEPAGSHRNPAWANLDLMASYRWPANPRTSVTFEARLLNVVNNQTQLATDAQKRPTRRSTWTFE